MQKAAIKAFICSFSISMLAFSVANRAFWYEKNITDTPVNISRKNIALFVKNLQTYRHPVKKIDLNILADTTPQQDNFGSVDVAFNDVITADEPEYISVPLKNTVAATLAEVTPEVQKEVSQTVEEKIVYAASVPIEMPVIDEKPVYSPENGIAGDAIKEPENINSLKQSVVYAGDNPVNAEEITPPPIKIAINNAPVPLVYEKSNKTEEISLGKAEDMNHIAMASEKSSIESMVQNTAEQPSYNSSKKWQTLNDNPWVIAKANGVNRNLLADEMSSAGVNSEVAATFNIQKGTKGVDVAAETVKNLIIPLPEKLADDENLMPKLAYPSSSDDAKKEKIMNARSLREEAKKEQQSLLTEIDDDDEPEMTLIPDKEQEEEKSKGKSILSSLSNMLSGKKKNNVVEPQNKPQPKSKASARSAIRRAAKANRPVSIIPKEIKMSFQPNKAEISGQTLRWVQAFATKAAEEENTSLEVRIDGSRPSVLQQRRLNMLYNILTHKGVEYSKINVIFTAREPNSFILRMINSNSKEQENTAKINTYGNNHVQW